MRDKQKCYDCGELLETGIKAYLDHKSNHCDNSLVPYVDFSLSIEDFDNSINKFTEDAYKEWEEEKKKEPSFKERLEAVKSMSDNHSYMIPHHPKPFKGRYMNGKAWKIIYGVN